MRTVLTVDTATSWVTAGLVRTDDAGVPVEVHAATVDDGRAHGERLAGHVQQVLAAAGARPADLDAVVVGVGPGPYTGLRVGIATAATVAELAGVPLYPVGSLDAVAAGWVERPLLVVTDARRREVYWARYGADPSGPQVGGADSLDVEGCTVVGDGAVQYGLPGARPAHPLPAGLVAVAAGRIAARAPGEVAVPRYLRRPDAVVPTSRRTTVQR